MANKKQLVIIGAGPGGYAAAFHADNLGLDVTLIDPREKPGGVCLYQGCIPTKALLHFAETIREAEAFRDKGLEFGDINVNREKLRAWKESVVDKLTSGVEQLAKSRKIEYIRGTARFKTGDSLEVEEHEGGKRTVEFENLIIATGGKSRSLPNIDFDGKLIMNAASALELDDIPKKLLVVGAGYIGLEMSAIYQSLGSEITLVEMTQGILPGIDKDLASVFRRERKDLLEGALFNSRVEKADRKGKGLRVKITSEKNGNRELEFDKMLVAIGSSPNTKGIGLEEAGIDLDDQGFIRVDEYRRTGNRNIYAIGDVAGEPMLAHKASHEGRVAVEHIAGRKTAWEPKAIPAVVFTEPEIAWTGMTENEAREKGIDIEVAKFPWSASGRAITLGRKHGLTKLIFNRKTKRLLGGAAAGKNAGTLIPEITLAIEMAAVAKDLELTIHPHPTLSETIMEAAEIFLGEPTHVLKQKKKT